MADLKSSYSAADCIPVKLIKNYELMHSMMNNKRILPIHVQFIITNKCNLNCLFCSCSKDDRKTEMSLEDARKLIAIMASQGTRSVTLTGGGEPLLHPHFSEILECLFDAGIKVGLVTNGLKLKPDLPLNEVTWCRISNDDHRKFTERYSKCLSETVQAIPEVDWAFSHVVSSEPNIDEIQRVIEFANLHKFTHVRLVADLLDYCNINLNFVKEEIRKRGVDDRTVIYQKRNRPVKGGDCYICYLKPVIGADCKVSACCGSQYALKKPSRCMPPELCLGSAFDLEKIINNSHKPFNGSICYRCYYENYNKILGAILSDTEHMDFV